MIQHRLAMARFHDGHTSMLQVSGDRLAVVGIVIGEQHAPPGQNGVRPGPRCVLFERMEQGLH